ncbi:hypothetical protein C8J42_101948 [Sphingomonas sp. PP-CE-1A-559]|uniref:hypothetical protein n=1 Tax=Sphingomonas sp. PP-CE-1A-559 TaxID=2135657 RepID=UPI001054D495|nr:hypothetical protein [Sphingomonas sp. PP-CE-1A-559]TCP94482.1 hypothetical protein C8J42_101948 [Sphingomonas sp. PP-CE-1A-559]
MSRSRDRDGLDLNDIASLIAATRPPAVASEERGLAKHAATIIVAIILALCLWVGASVSSLGTTVTRMSANVDALQKGIADLQTSQGSASIQLSDTKATNAKQDARADAMEADVLRVKERVRMLEGQRPVHIPAPTAE